MKLGFVRRCAVLVVLGGLAACAQSSPGNSPAPSAAQSTVPAAAGKFDGTWAYTLTDQSGNPVCQGFGTGTLDIRASNFSGVLAHENAGSFYLSGSVGDEGALKNVMASGAEMVTFSGSLNDTAGTGRWTSDNCNGTWKLLRQ